MKNDFTFYFSLPISEIEKALGRDIDQEDLFCIAEAYKRELTEFIYELNKDVYPILDEAGLEVAEVWE